MSENIASNQSKPIQGCQYDLKCKSCCCQQRKKNTICMSKYACHANIKFFVYHNLSYQIVSWKKIHKQVTSLLVLASIKNEMSVQIPPPPPLPLAWSICIVCSTFLNSGNLTVCFYVLFPLMGVLLLFFFQMCPREDVDFQDSQLESRLTEVKSELERKLQNLEEKLDAVLPKLA